MGLGEKVVIELSSGAGPTDGGSHFLSTYQAELSRMIEILYIFYSMWFLTD